MKYAQVSVRTSSSFLWDEAARMRLLGCRVSSRLIS